MRASHHTRPQWFTGPRLLRLGEGIELCFSVPPGMQAGDLEVFPRYLERMDPGPAFSAGGDLSWLDAVEPERVPLHWDAGVASLTYRPREPGSYLARWRAGTEVYHRYFAAVEDDWVVLRFSTFEDLESEPTLHATGIPLDYRLPVERFAAGDPLFERLLGYHRRFGDAVVPQFPDTPGLSTEERVQAYGPGLERARALMPAPRDMRSARVEMRHELDPGYTETFLRLGLDDHWGLQEANARPWLGMPEFPYFASPVDCRKANQGEGGMVAHQWDFCGGWHFLGPVSWHYKAAEGDWAPAARCLRRGVEELVNLAALSGHPAFAVPLYDGLVGPGYPNPGFRYDAGAGTADRAGALPMLEFVERYQRFMAFAVPKEHRAAYARSIDIADYYRRHFRVTPRTVFVSRTDHVLYDMWWLCSWCNHRVLVPRERIPWETRPSTVFRLRDAVYPFKDPLSCEYVLVEDQRRSIRFERECPNPIWWFDYATQERGPQGSAADWVRTPDVDVLRSPWVRDEGGWSVTLRMQTAASFAGYAVCLWGLPVQARPDVARIQTNAREHVLARNGDAEWHLVLFFDLQPGVEVHVRLLDEPS